MAVVVVIVQITQSIIMLRHDMRQTLQNELILQVWQSLFQVPLHFILTRFHGRVLKQNEAQSGGAESTHKGVN